MTEGLDVSGLRSAVAFRLEISREPEHHAIGGPDDHPLVAGRVLQALFVAREALEHGCILERRLAIDRS